MRRELTYPSVESGQIALQSLMSKSEFESIIEKTINKIFKDKGFDGKVNDEMVKYYADQLWDAVTSGYGADLSTVDFDTPDYLMLQKLQENVWQFAAAKNYTELKAISNALVNPDGLLREFKDFKVAATQISDEHNSTWLKTEYNFAVAGSQMAAKWERIQESKDHLPMLTYVTVGDDRVRPAHRELEGVTRPVDDPFWSIYYPPNGWNCRCIAQQGDGEATLLKDILYPEEMPALFKYNIGKSGVIFPPTHPYWTGIPDDVKQRALELMKNE
jgi:SPP1 gp7 family putative phage head morphogenesis protein